MQLPPVADLAPLVEVRNVTKIYGAGVGRTVALDDVSLSIGDNEFFTLLGPSGCGKTTLLRMLGGFDVPTSGSILLDHRDVVKDPPNARPVNTVFQSYALFPHMTIEQNVAFGLERKGMRGPEVAHRVAAMLRLVRLDAVGRRRPGELSGGQQQRVALARALAPSPRLLLLDEPMSALDLKLRREMQTELKRIQRETGIAFVLVTHDQQEALSMSDRIAVMNEGRILQIDSPKALYERPRSRFVADFIGQANILPGALVGLPSVFAAIRPERVFMRPSQHDDPPSLIGRVCEITYLGATTSVTVALPDGRMIKADIGQPQMSFSSGQDICCVFPPDALLPLEV